MKSDNMKDKENRPIITSWYEAELIDTITTTEKDASLEALESRVFSVRKNLAGEVISPPREVRIYAVQEEKRLLYVRKK